MGWLRSIKVLKHVDASAIEHNRVTRLIGTVNMKSNLYCIYLGNEKSVSTWDLDTILKNAKANVSSGDVGVRFNDLAELKKYDMEARHIKTKRTTGWNTKSRLFAKPSHYPECMRVLLDEAMQGTSLGHAERVELGKFLLHVTGNNVSQVTHYQTHPVSYTHLTLPTTPYV